MKTREAMLLLGAALACIYGIDAASMFSRVPADGVVLVAIAAAQASWLYWLQRLQRPALIAAATLNAALVALWLLSRTVGLPLGPPGPQPVGLLDLLCTADSVAIVACALALVGMPTRVFATVGRAMREAAVVLSVASLSTLTAGAHAHSIPSPAGNGQAIERHYFCRLL